MRSNVSTFATLVMTVLALAACGDDGPSGPGGTLANFAQGLTDVVNAQITEDETQNSIKGLAEALAQSLTTSTPAPSPREPGILASAMALSNAGGASWIPSASGPSPFNQVPRVPLDGITCVWDTEVDFWVRDAADPFGAVPEGSVRFALYDALNGEPVLPLAPVADAFTDIAPVLQAPQNNGSFQVDIYAEEGSGPRLDGVLGGTFISGLINASFSGLIGTDVAGIGFVAAISESSQGSSLTISSILTSSRGLLIDLSFNPDGSGTVIVLGVDGDPTNPEAQGNFVVEFVVPFSANFQATGGEVLVNGDLVATVTGGLAGSPTFTIEPDGPLGANSGSSLNSMYATTWTLYAHFVELLTLGLCVGTEDTGICNQLGFV